MSKPKKAAPKRKPAVYNRPEPIPAGEILTDVQKKSWKLGPTIGAGGFGDIYSAAQVTETSKKKSEFPFVVKIEPHENGPLFVEMHFYMRVCREEDMSTWVAEHKLATLGIPRLLGWGSHDRNNIKHRFLVLDRLGADVGALLAQNGRRMPQVTAAKIADQVITALEYIHSKGYVHADVKAANLLLSPSDPERVVLVDFGMASKISVKPDPRRAHNGTPEYASRDAHTGAMTMRGDVETVCLNLVHWLSGTLPWETRIADLARLHADKQTHLADIPGFLQACFKTDPAPDWLSTWLRLSTAPSTDNAPDYAALRRAVRAAPGFSAAGPLTFAPAAEPAKKRVTAANGASPAKRGRPTRATTANSDAKPTAKNGTPKGRAKKRDTSSESDDFVNDSPPTVSKPKRQTNRKPATVAVVTPSWRDGAAITNSNVTRPGEYQRMAK